jgi:hypothetical protein
MIIRYSFMRFTWLAFAPAPGLSPHEEPGLLGEPAQVVLMTAIRAP